MTPAQLGGTCVHILKSCANSPPLYDLGILAPGHLNSSWVLLLGFGNSEAIEPINSLFIFLTSHKHGDRVMTFEGPSETMGPMPSDITEVRF